VRELDDNGGPAVPSVVVLDDLPVAPVVTLEAATNGDGIERRGGVGVERLDVEQVDLPTVDPCAGAEPLDGRVVTEATIHPEGRHVR